MADKSIGELTAATAIGPLDLLVMEQGGTAKKVTGQLLEQWLLSFADGHGGIQSITYTPPVPPSLIGTMEIVLSDASMVSVPVANGAKGDQGNAWYVHIRYSAVEPTSNAQMGTQPDDWMGIYSGISATAPTSYTAYTWFKIKGEKGNTGDASEVTGQTHEYCLSYSGSTVPAGPWSETVPDLTNVRGQFLWERTTLSFNDGSTAVWYSPSYLGLDGVGTVNTVDNVPVASGTNNVPLGALRYNAAQILTTANIEQLLTNMGWTVANEWED